MCGIIGIIGKDQVADRLVDGLRRMEYRGYDSAGVCTVDHGQLIRRRAPGKLINLVHELADHPAPGVVGIAHTRWATHGAPTATNAHPHATGEVALVHNGIIENYRAGAFSKATPTAKSSPIWCPNRSRPACRHRKPSSSPCRNCAALLPWRSPFASIPNC